MVPQLISLAQMEMQVIPIVNLITFLSTCGHEHDCEQLSQTNYYRPSMPIIGYHNKLMYLLQSAHGPSQAQSPKIEGARLHGGSP